MVASGITAIACAIQTIAEAGDNIISAPNTHRQLNADEQAKACVKPDLVRMFIGNEQIDNFL